MNAPAPRTPDQLTAENALICEKLLGLKKHCDEPDCTYWRTADGARYWNNHSFATWADAGLILEAMAERSPVVWRTNGEWQAHFHTPWEWNPQPTGPLAVRAAALEYIRSLP